MWEFVVVIPVFMFVGLLWVVHPFYKYFKQRAARRHQLESLLEQWLEQQSVAQQQRRSQTGRRENC